MQEREKLEEAWYFLRRMQEVQDDRRQFGYNLSAFLSAARSVMYYADQEAKRTDVGRQWRDQQWTSRPLLKFFTEMRRAEVHVRPTNPNQNVTVFVPPLDVTLSIAVNCVVVDADGNIKPEPCHSEPTGQTQLRRDSISNQSPSSSHSYYWVPEYPSEDLMELCQKYLAELRGMLQDGTAKGLFSL